METLSLQTVLEAERQALALGGPQGAHAVGLRKAALKWALAAHQRTLVLEGGVSEAIARIISARAEVLTPLSPR